MCKVVSKHCFFKKNHCFPQKNLFFQKTHCFPKCALFYPIVLKRKIITGYYVCYRILKDLYSEILIITQRTIVMVPHINKLSGKKKLKLSSF